MISYAKLRASWAQVGNDTAPYRLSNTLAADEIWAGLPSFSVPGRRENADLRPETTESWEFGTELAFLDNRLGLDLTYYKQQTRDQVMPSQVSTASGYRSQMINAGVVENKGWEVLLRGTPYSGTDLRWESTLTWAKNTSTVVELSEGVTGIELGLADFWFVSLFAREGEPMGQLVALFDYNYDPDGNIIVNSSGLPTVDFGANSVIGNVNPDWRAGWGNQVSYKGMRLGFLLDMRQGGEIYSVTKAFGRYSGVLAETAEGGRCSSTGVAQPGHPVCDASNGIVFDGVNEIIDGVTGDTSYVANTTAVDQQNYYQNNFLLPRTSLEDATYIKLRERSKSGRGCSGRGISTGDEPHEIAHPAMRNARIESMRREYMGAPGKREKTTVVSFPPLGIGKGQISSPSDPRTSSTCPATFTFGKTFFTRPLASRM